MNSRILDTAPPTPAPNSCDDTTYVGGPGGCRVVASVPAAFCARTRTEYCLPGVSGLIIVD
ncbi:uncharacterized protein PHALS_06930 [Plasmopara halstedii]|uniref:Uncharacterized protein n=1 Tax=Plasmopara halstedii TaxID=4781 RepID=A0A0P1B571_PLAHL|nr:uncharacterized protein PHALS_06930 [Plasmopara halstedii]CEG49151.1 hypothetical protein PHALS_06930 [Plasmopara halstedii]|eukprot:XP_024585520.1 hypothetical protein PHALS_06930 [Plasmopara halstedii]